MSLKVEGRSEYVIKEKHKQLKGSLGRWNTGVFGRLNLEVQEGKDEINEVDEFLSCCKEDQVKEIVIIRISVIILMGYMRNFIGYISTDRGLLMLKSVGEVKEEVMRHFSEKFREPKLNKPQLEGIIFSVLSHSDMSSLEFNFLEQETKEVVSECKGSNSPGSVSLEYLRYIVKRMGIGEVWMKWIEATIFSSKMSVMVNGSTIEEFEDSRGLR
ncbi:hypothetical protein KIW84_015383 [Lathyrus oleraceus]|uniref:Uncharacterized protein n=1 Tax=Pisum sativum TaxID=3888 RepID=A0A9D5H0J8_PEA|nr:hypothetical protein KIW84_015383 [Pisum sativum]